MDGTTFGASAGELAASRDLPRPDAKFELTEDEVAELGEVLAKDYPPDAFGSASRRRASVGPPSFRAAKIDLDGDGTDEILTLLADRYHCGSGGCTFRVYARTSGRLRKVSGSTITRLPIAVTDTTTEDWRDLTVFTCGGGLDPCGRSRLRFDGSGYPLNPSMPPAEPTEEIGTVVLTAASPVHRMVRPREES